MKKMFLSLISFVFVFVQAFAQGDTTRLAEPNRETSYDNQELLVIALVGLALLLLLYFFFRRSRR